jgi:hypothetical protein
MLRSSVERGGDPRALLELAEELLGEDVWREDEKQELRSIRDAQVKRLHSSPIDELRSAFAADECVEVGPNRVRLVFVLGKQHDGALEQGSWILNGSGWSPPFAARSDGDLLERRGPLLLLEPLRTEKEPLELGLQLEQPADQPPHLLLVSALGFQIGFLGASDGGKARWLASAGTAAELVEALRKGSGTEFSGWKAGSKPLLGLTIRRAPGRVVCTLDGKPIGRLNLPAPHQGGPPAIGLCAWECLRLVSLTLVASRR